MKIMISTLAFLVLGFFNQVLANTQYVFTNDAKFQNEKGELINLFVGIPLDVKKDNGKTVTATITAYVYGLELFSSKNKELLIAKLPLKLNKKDGSKVEIVGTIEKENLTDIASEVWEEQEEFFFDMCTQCHAAPKVPAHNMIEWEALFGGMRGFAKLDDEEAAYLLRYLKSNASNGLIKATH